MVYKFKARLVMDCCQIQLEISELPKNSAFYHFRWQLVALIP